MSAPIPTPVPTPNPYPGLNFGNNTAPAGLTFGNPNSTSNPNTLNVPQAFSSGGLQYNSGPQVLGANTAPPPSSGPTPPPGNNPPSGAPNYSSNTGPAGSQTVSFGGHTFRSDGKGGWVAADSPSVASVSQADIDNAYNPVLGSINQQIGDWNSGQQAFINSYTDPYKAIQPTLDTAYQQGVNLNQNQQQQNQTQTQNAIDAAKQLYSEQQQGVQQRFGGIGSTADFAQAFYGRAFGQNQQQALTTGQQNQGQLNTQLSNLQSQYQANTKQLQDQVAAASDQAQKDFNTRLQQLEDETTMTQQAKATAKLDALTQLKATINQINQNATAFQQQQQLSFQQAATNLMTQVASYQAFARQPVNLSAVQPYVQQLIGGGQSQYNPLTGLTGQYTPTRYDQNGNPIQG